MNAKLHILHLEDSEGDAELLLAVLKAQNLDCIVRRVQTEADFCQALEQFSPDIIIGDYALPSYSGTAALQRTREIRPNIPFIFLSGTIGEEAAVELLKSGAVDYVSKDRIRRIVPSIHRALAENKERLLRQEAEERLRRSEANLRAAQEQARLGTWEYNLETGEIWWSEQMYMLFGCDPAKGPPGVERFFDLMHPEDREFVVKAHATLPLQREPLIITFRLEPTLGQTIFEALVHPLLNSAGKTVAARGTILDITARKQAKELARAGERRLARQRDALIALAGSKVFAESDFVTTIRHISKVVAETLEVARVSIWQYSPDRSRIVCLNLFDQRTGEHTSGTELERTRYPSWFQAMEKAQIIAAEDAFTDPCTCEFGPDYLKPLGIGAMLDAPIHALGTSHAVLCHEHVGGPRVWTSDEKTFAAAVANFVTLAIETDERRKAVDALKRSEERFREIAENMQEVFYSFDPSKGEVLYVNPAYEQVWGRSPDWFTGPFAYFETIHPEDRHIVESAIRRQSAGEATTSEYRVVRPDHSICWVRDNAYPVIDPSSGKVVRVVGVADDITETKRAEAAMHESLERFRMLARATNDAIWDKDILHNRLQWGNEAFYNMFGFEAEELGQSSQAWLSLVHEEDREPTLSSLAQALNGDAEHWSGEYRFQRKDGSYAYVMDRGYILRDRSGKPVRMIGAMTDLSHRKEAENRIAEQAALLDAASDAILLMSLDDRILFWNRGAERVFGWQAQDAIGQDAGELLGIDAAKFAEANREIKTQGTWQGELAARAKDGRKLVTVLRWSTVVGKNGEAQSILAIITDVTQQKALEAQFLRAQRMESIGTLASGIAHDLNNVLAPVMMSVELLKTEVSEPAQPLLETLETSCKRGSDLVKQVLSFARGVEGERVMVNPLYLFKDIDSIIRKTFPKNIEFTTNAPRNLWTVMGDPTQLHQVFLNLCVNARDAMPQGGRLSVNMENIDVDDVFAGLNPELKPGAYIMITVNDTGTGIPEDICEKIFEPFFTTKEVGRGTGLGLSTTSAIVRSHGGVIKVYSEVGRGSQFKVYLPANTRMQAAQDPSTNEPLIPTGNGELILVVDDEAGVQAIAQQTLQKFGYRVLAASNGAEALAIYAQRQGEVAAVITDMTMPVMDGATTIKALKALNPHVRIIASSGLPLKITGIKHTIPKPYTAASLAKTVAAALNDH